MIGEPLYDNDLVNLGYLNKQLEDSNVLILSKSQNYGTTPTPPYRKNDTYMDGTNIYICINTRLLGNFNPGDWSLASTYTDDTLANSKNKVFNNEPVTPYKIGDLWAQGENGELRRCIYSRTKDEEFNIADWDNATKYDSTKTTVEGGLVTTGTIQVVQGGTGAAGITGNTSGDSAIRFWAGSTMANRNNAPFRVTQGGFLYASNANITGTITATSGSFSGTITSANATITGGSLKVGTNFEVDTSGNLKATNVDITGKITATSGSFSGTITSANATITGGSLKVGTNFEVDTSGNLKATNANITGKITATSGSFSGTISGATIRGSTMYTGTTSAGWILTSNYIKARENGNTSLYSNGNFGFYGNHRIAAHDTVIINSQQGKGLIIGDGMINATDGLVKIYASSSSYIHLQSSNGIRINGPISVSETGTGERTNTYTGNPYYSYNNNKYRFIVINGLICGSERVS